MEKNRPHDTAFKQQRLKAWQPILTPRWVIFTFIIVGLVFVPVGFVLKSNSDAIFEQEVQYDPVVSSSSQPGLIKACEITSQNQGYNNIKNGSYQKCSIKFTFSSDVAASSQVQLFYQLNNFFQNHRRYVISRSDDQLRNGLVGLTPAAVTNNLKTACEPSTSYINGTYVYWPCGLISQSYFNDGIILESYNNLDRAQTVAAGVTLSSKGVAWASDMKEKFMNPTGIFSNNYTAYQYIWQVYDQMSCYDLTTDLLVPCITYSDVLGFPVLGNGCVKCPPTARVENQGGIQPPGGRDNFTSASVLIPQTNEESEYGVRTETFVVWMRTAGLPLFRKLFATITPPTGGFKKGDTLTFKVVPNFEVASFSGAKSLVISTTSSLGGKNAELGIAYFSVGGVCWALALAFLLKHLISPRKLGDTKFIVWRQRGT